MDINSDMSMLINLPIQLLSIFAINFFWLGYKPNVKDGIVITLLIIVPTIILYILFDALATFYLLAGVITFFYRKYRKNKMFIFHVLVSFVLAVIVNHFASIVSINTIEYFLSEFFFLLFHNAVFCVILVMLAFIYKRIAKDFLDKYLSGKIMSYFLITLIFFTLIFFYINIYKMFDKSAYENIQYNFWLFVVYLSLLIIIVLATIYLTLKHSKVQQKEKEYENFLVYVQSLEQVNKDMQKFRHDYLNILLSIQGYIDDKDLFGLNNYFKKNIATFEHKTLVNNRILGNLNHLNIKELKGLLYTKSNVAVEKNIAISIEIEKPIQYIPMNLMDLTRMLGILLDNAIESSVAMEEGAIQFAILQSNVNLTLISIKNRVGMTNVSMNCIFEEGYTTKEKGRGMGLAIVRQIVDTTPNITLNSWVEDGWFQMELFVMGEKS